MATKRELTYDILDNGCWKCNSHKLSGHGYINIMVNGKQISGHRYMYIQKYGKVNNEVLRHTCDNRWCVNPEHLIEGTHRDNVQDRVQRNRSAIGTANGRSKLSEDNVIEIYNNQEIPNSYFAKKFNVNATAIRNIKNGITWRYLTQISQI